MRRFVVLLVFLCALLAVSTLFAQDSGKLSGYMFGDMYYVSANHDNALEGENGFWFRRIYLGYDKGLAGNFKTKVRLEMSQPGNFSSKSKMTPVVKDAYLQWSKDGKSIYIGISGTPTWGVVEKFWGYRSVEKTLLDLQKMGSSRDFGIAFKGNIDPDKKASYHIMFANGNSNSSEVGKGKKAMASLLFNPGNGLTFEGYIDIDDKQGGKRRMTAQGFAGYKTKEFRIGVQYAYQSRRLGENIDDLTLSAMSIFGAAKFNDKVTGFARIDKMMDLNPDGAKVSYIPFVNSAKSTFLLGGIDITAAKDIHFMPNVEVVMYSEENGVSLDTDIIPRFTFYFKF